MTLAILIGLSFAAVLATALINRHLDRTTKKDHRP